MLGIVVSRADSASVHIGEHLLEIEDWERHEDDTLSDADGGGTVYRTDGACLREFDALHLDLDRPADAFRDPTLLAFASRHSGETGPLLTAHHTGNFGPADHGGTDNDLALAAPNAHARVLDALAASAPEGYDVGMECTHHGPSAVGAPSLFVEVGSSPAEWDDSDAAHAVARAILDLRGVSPYRPPENVGTRADGGADDDDTDGTDWNRRHLVGFGGGHYAPRFERVARETDWAVGHVAADWGLDALGDLSNPRKVTVLGAAFECSRGAYALVDGDRSGVVAAVEELGYRAVSETWVRETDGVPLPFVHTVEDAVTTVEEGLRFGERARELAPPDEFEFAVVSLPDELLDETRGIDHEAASDALVGTALAFGTDQGGTRPTGPIVLERPADREQVVDALLDVLRKRYDSVERDGDVVLAREEAFDPDRARTLGVPEGPAFGKLADGEAVDLDGETIPPDVVRTERERTFRLDW